MFSCRVLFCACTLVALLFSAAAAMRTDPPATQACSAMQDASGKWSVVDGIKNGSIAWGYYKNSIHQDGWAHLNITTDSSAATADQAFGMGVVEGFLSQSVGHIEDYGTNQFDSWGFSPDAVETQAPELFEYMTDNLAYMRQASSEKYSDPTEQAVFTQVGLILQQLEGIFFGYQLAAPNNNYTLLDIALLNAAGDMETLVELYPPKQNKKHEGNAHDKRDNDNRIILDHTAYHRRPDMGLDCSALVRLTPDKSDLIMTHATWRQYKLMNRVYKVVTFNGRTDSFASAPGFISSKDDFYVTSYNLAVYETTNSIYDESLYAAVNPETLLTWVRSVVANREATNGADWVDIFARHNSGTYNCQFGIVDYNAYAQIRDSLMRGAELADARDVFWIIEQVPGFTESQDLTGELLEMGFFPSFNVPYLKTIQNLSGYKPDVYETSSRYLIFRRDAPHTTNVADVQALIRSNNYTEDEYCKTDPGRAVSARYDLRPFALAVPFGAVDAKITSFKMLFPSVVATFTASTATATSSTATATASTAASSGLKALPRSSFSVLAVSGPTHGDVGSVNLAPFDWSLFEKTVHQGQPQVWDFDWVDVTPGKLY